MRTFPTSLAPFLLTGLLSLAGCTVSAYDSVSLESLDLESVSRPTMLAAGPVVRLANLAGEVELHAVDGDRVVVEAQVYSDDPELISAMVWTQREDAAGHSVWTLDYPLDRFSRFHYSLEGSLETSTTMFGEDVRIGSRKPRGTPTVFADLSIGVPKGTVLHFRSVLGRIDAAGVEGDLELSLGAGSVRAVNASGAGFEARTSSGSIEASGLRAGHVVLRTGSGGIVLRGARSESCKIRTASGSIELGDIESAELDAETGSGSIEIRGCSGTSLEATTGSGSIEVRATTYAEQRLSTGSGNIEVDTDLAGAKQLRAATGSGDILVRAGADAQFTLATASGDVDVGYADAELRRDDRRIVGATRGDGSTQIELRAGSGDCELRP